MVKKFAFLAILLFILLPLQALALTIDSTNFSSYTAGQWGEFSVQNKTLIYSSTTDQSIILVQPNSSEVINKIDFSNLSYSQGVVGFIWKLKNQDFSQENQMQLTLIEGKILLPNEIPLSNFDVIGFVFFSKSVSFDSFTLGKTSFSDNLSTFLQAETVKPSSINLLYGAKWGDTPFVKILGTLSLLFFLVLIFISRKWALLSILFFWILFDIRYMYDRYVIFQDTKNKLVNQEKVEEKKYYDFYNFYGFIEESKKYMKGDVNFYAPSEWPFSYNYSYHMLPVKSWWKTTDKPYYALFQVKPEIKENGELYIDGKLVEKNIEVLKKFDDNSYILKKK